MTLFSTEHPFSTDVDVSSSAFWAQPFDRREESFARLRAQAPVSRHRPVDWLLAGEMFHIFGVGQELAAHRRTHPGDDRGHRTGRLESNFINGVSRLPARVG